MPLATCPDQHSDKMPENLIGPVSIVGPIIERLLGKKPFIGQRRKFVLTAEPVTTAGGQRRGRKVCRAPSDLGQK